MDCLPGEIRLSNCCKLVGVDGVDEQRGNGNGGASLKADGHGDGEYD